MIVSSPLYAQPKPTPSPGTLRGAFVAVATLVLSLCGLAVPAAAVTAGPAWKIEVLIYPYTDITYMASGVSHRLVGSLVPEEVANIKNSMAGFVDSDVPALSSGRQHPKLTFKTINKPLDSTSLVPDGGGGWTPDPRTTKTDQDPGYDSYIVFWQSYGWDWGTSASDNIGHYGGLTWDLGTAPTFSEITLSQLNHGGHNVIKHEWGHAITIYYDATGIAPKPMADNHHPESSVNCKTGKGYVLLDETALSPIPNSIFNNSSGFTHDYYSGLTAQASNPRYCIGITSKAWASGGPVTKR
jgi:hypothetical protein